MPYKKPILIEMIAEFRLPPGTLGVDAFRPLMVALADAGFAHNDFMQLGTLTLGPDGMNTLMAPRVRCRTPQRTRCVQFSADFVAVNYADVYPGKHAFLDLVGTALDVLRAGPFGACEATETAIVALDEFRLDHSFRIGDYFNCDGRFLPTQLAEAGACQFHLASGHRSIELAVRQVSAQETGAFLQTSIRRPLHGTATDVQNLVEESASLFLELITAKTEAEIMGGKL